jgi:hypothetical protein
MPNRAQLEAIEALALQLTDLRAEAVATAENARRLSPLYESNQLLAAILLELKQLNQGAAREPMPRVLDNAIS